MSKSAFSLRSMAASTAVVLAFAPLAQAAGLIDDQVAVGTYRPAFSMALTAVAKEDPAPAIRAGGFMKEFETALAAPSDKTRIVDYPKPATSTMLRVTAVVPPKGLESLPIPVCAEQNQKVLATWLITSKGQVVPAAWNGSTVGEGNSAACKAFILAARADINQKLAQGEAAPVATVSAVPTLNNVRVATASARP